MKILVTGASGLLGLNCLEMWRHKHTLVGAVHHGDVSLRGVKTRRVNVADRAQVFEWIASETPDLVLHAAGLTNVDVCESDPPLARRLNVDASENVAAAAAAAGSALIHISTDHLFDGTRRMYRETDPTSPVNVYGETKLAAEEKVMAAHPKAFVLRTNFFGWGHRRRVSFSDWILQSLKKGAPLNMFDDVFFTTILVNDLLDVALDVASTASPGIYNVTSGERMSKYEFGMMVADVFGFDSSPLKPATADSATLVARRPKDMSLDCSKTAAAIGRPLPSTRDGLLRLKRLSDEGLPAALNSALADGAVSPHLS